MNTKLIFGLGGFLCGGLGGFLVSKTYYDIRLDEELESYRSYLKEKEKIDDQVLEELESYKKDMEKGKKIEDPDNITEYKTVAKKYGQMYQKPSIDSLIDEFVENEADQEEEPDEEHRYQILEDTDTLREDVSVEEIVYDDVDNVFTNSLDEMVDIKELIGHKLTAKYVMGELGNDEVSILDLYLDVVYEITRESQMEEPALSGDEYEAPKSPRERRKEAVE